jgi:hypothetical protein
MLEGAKASDGIWQKRKKSPSSRIDDPTRGQSEYSASSLRTA